MNAPANISLTPCGRVAGTPLEGRFEALASELALGKSWEAALVDLWRERIRIRNPEASSFRDNVRKLRRERPDVTERANELASDGARLLGINAAWVLKETKLFAEASPARFFKRDETGQVLTNSHGVPLLDFASANGDDLRTIKTFKPTKFGTVIEVHDPNVARNQFGQYFGLWKGQSDASATALNVTIMRFGDQTKPEGQAA